MSKILAFVAMGALFAAGQACAEDYQFIDVDNQMLVTVDKDSIRSDSANNTVTSLTMTVFKTPRDLEGKKVSILKNFNEYDCSRRRAHQIGYMLFNRNGELLLQNVESEPWESVEPNTNLEQMLLVSCGKSEDMPIGKTMRGVAGQFWSRK